MVAIFCWYTHTDEEDNKEGRQVDKRTVMGKATFKGEILVGHDSRGFAASGASFSYKFQGRNFLREGGQVGSTLSPLDGTVSVSAQVPPPIAVRCRRRSTYRSTPATQDKVTLPIR